MASELTSRTERRRSRRWPTSDRSPLTTRTLSSVPSTWICKNKRRGLGNGINLRKKCRVLF